MSGEAAGRSSHQSAPCTNIWKNIATNRMVKSGNVSSAKINLHLTLERTLLSTQEACMVQDLKLDVGKFTNGQPKEKLTRKIARSASAFWRNDKTCQPILYPKNCERSCLLSSPQKKTQVTVQRNEWTDSSKRWSDVLFSLFLHYVCVFVHSFERDS